MATIKYFVESIRRNIFRRSGRSTKWHFDKKLFRRNGSVDKVSFNEVLYIQLQKMARGLKFLIWEIEGLYYLGSENKAADQLRDYST